MERLFIILALILAAAAAYFLWFGNGDAAFILVALAVVSYFLNVRSQIKGRVTNWQTEELERQREEDDVRKRELAAHDETGIVNDPGSNHDLTNNRSNSKSKIENRDG